MKLLSTTLIAISLLSIHLKADVILYAEDTLTKTCDASEVYVGPNKAEYHGGTCLGIAYTDNPQLGYNINNYTGAVYTLRSESCPTINPNMVYVGPWKAHEHGGYCVKGTAEPTLNRHSCGASVVSTGKNTETQTGRTVYVGPRKAHEHGGHCYTLTEN
ncbi:hypothetical protein Rhein_2987 [Rheinheimera sp. A13L]|uniref:hypothetical protein n=1 Tax=Rheinheimera sp. A13L TaxID=506534 RepID=UPI000212525C|nr:hypothetical protein [Rheinheimera sp. A13L]EGM76751.1 hypothetical protein Rhein_2987 [Rheinheimera sp. A13L]